MANNKPQQIIDTNQLVELLQDFPGHTIAYIRTLTKPSKFNATSRVTKLPLNIGVDPANIRKISLWSVRIGYDYEKSVNNEREKEGIAPTFQSQGLWNGKGHAYVTPSGMVSKTIRQHEDGELYLSCIMNKWRPDTLPTPMSAKKMKSRCRSMFIDITTGKKIDKKELVDFLPKKYPSKSQGVAVEVEYRTLKLQSIKMLSFRGTSYHLA